MLPVKPKVAREIPVEEGGPVIKEHKTLLAGIGGVVAMVAMFVTLGLGVPAQHSAKSGSVYVCGCMKTSSCPCAAMSNKGGKCPCGDEMKAVPRHSKWANTNRTELSNGH
jgi:hypothetical protein